MKCVNCNKEIKETFKFCPYCGRPIRKLPPIPKINDKRTE